jgi:hypothetical protein
VENKKLFEQVAGCLSFVGRFVFHFYVYSSLDDGSNYIKLDSVYVALYAASEFHQNGSLFKKLILSRIWDILHIYVCSVLVESITNVRAPTNPPLGSSKTRNCLIVFAESLKDSIPSAELIFSFEQSKESQTSDLREIQRDPKVRIVGCCGRCIRPVGVL